MIGTLLTWLTTALSLLVVDLVVPGVDFATDNFLVPLLAAVAIGLVNSGIRPILTVLSLPLNLLSFGLFSLVINGLCFWLASVFVPSFYVHGLLGFLLGPVILSLVSTFLNRYFAEKNYKTPELEA
jgi:putative membrane protein